MLTVALAVAVVALMWVLWFVPDSPDPVDEAYDSLPCGRPEPKPLRVDTTTGSHDDLPIQPNIRQMLTDYCEGMWQHTTEDKR